MPSGHSPPTGPGAAAPAVPEIPPSPFRAPPARLRAIVFGAGFVLFALIALDVHYDGGLTELDLKVGRWVNLNVDKDTRVLFEQVLALPGDDTVIFPTLAIGSALVAALGRWRTGVLMLASGFLAGLTVWTLKAYFAEDRPSVYFGDADVLVVSKSFPSGHTTDTTIIAGLLIYFLTYTWVSRTRRDPRPLVVPLTGLWIALSVLMGLFRILGGVHWPTDVLGGWALGTAWLAATITAHDIWVRPFEQLARGRRPLNEAVL